jgi:hypothetical protein
VLAIEKAAAGRSLIQVLKKETKIPIEEMKPLKSKTTRLQAVCPMMEAGRVKIAEGEWTENFIKELTSFPFVKHDDCTDAFTWALTYYAMKLDAVDRGVQDAIIVNKKFRGSLLRAGLRDNMLFPETPKGSRSRGLFTSDNLLNDPDYSGNPGSADPRQPLTHRSQGFGRGDLRFD